MTRKQNAKAKGHEGHRYETSAHRRLENERNYSNKFSEIEPLLLAHVRQSKETKLAPGVKQNFHYGATVQN